MKQNENQLLKMENISGEVKKLFTMSLLGRNLALVYCCVSLGVAINIKEDMAYSLPAILGSFAMLGSFISHLSMEKPNYQGSLVQFQNEIRKFRMHTTANMKYDMAVVAFWILTFVPAYLKSIHNISLYSDLHVHSTFCLIFVFVITMIIALSRKKYRENNQKLIKSEACLAELIALENI